jgi:hypothetical protein
VKITRELEHVAPVSVGQDEVGQDYIDGRLAPQRRCRLATGGSG